MRVRAAQHSSSIPLTLIDSGTLSLGRAAWAQFQLDTMVLSIAIIYAPSDSSRAKAFLWHQLKGVLPNGQWIILEDYNIMESALDSFGPSPLLNGQQ